ncbi:MAG: hypothetical protein BWK80_05450 [Desulfobacteraceae bacterium IS3]|nr:MAG: hypothetical protein BWK80_05450 [Desulfobacteraceae bacterium IS3]
MKFFTDDDVVVINGKAVKKIYGGFGTGQPAILAKQAAELHGYEVREINQLVNNNLKWFDEGIDMFDLKKIITSTPQSAIIQNDRQHIADIKAFLLDF